MNRPASTYRIQFHSGFNFHHFESIIPYLKKLGVHTVYASPIFESVGGSLHGYDGVNPLRIDGEIGTEEQLLSIHTTLKNHGINWLQDIVPNHMAFHPQNEWLMDVLEKGQQSLYASFFDVTWDSDAYEGKLMVPFLGGSLEEVIQKKELQIVYKEARLVWQYGDVYFPLHPQSYATVLSVRNDPHHLQSIQQLLREMQELKQTEEAHSYSEKWHEWLLQFESFMKVESSRTMVNNSLEYINDDPARLQQMANEQMYRLCHWQETDGRINYRRFFTINGLICLNIQHEKVFDQYHQLIKQLLNAHIFQGLRIDHIDGLYDPTQYLHRLRDMAGEQTYIVAEKILAQDEKLPSCWPIEGTTGYDFLAIVNNLFTNEKSKGVFTNHYNQLTKDTRTVPQQIWDAKAHILHHHMSGELENLCRLFYELDLVDRVLLKTFTKEEIKNAIGAFLIYCPVYRFYPNALPFTTEEAGAVAEVFASIQRAQPELMQITSMLEEVWLQKPLDSDEEYNHRALHFFKRCMQFSGPVMAKGVEDTLMYSYHRFVTHNEVGDAVDAFGISIQAFHQKMKESQQHQPFSLNATATHDTKRGEDVRARLNVLTDSSEEWFQKVEEWKKLNADLNKNLAPDAPDEYFIYQTLAGAYPMPGEADDNFQCRLQEYLQKALREGKRSSNWTSPNEDYERATKEFAVGLLNVNRPFWKSFITFHKKLSHFGVINSLSQVLLKFTCPGVPDVYQGDELWDLNLVDPDNRRPVNYNKRLQWLDELNADENPLSLIKKLWQHRFDGRIKLWLVQRLMHLRIVDKDWFELGEYIPLQTAGKYKEHVLAFARRYRQQWIVAIVPLHIASVTNNIEVDFNWSDTRVLLPKNTAPAWENLLLNDKIHFTDHVLLNDVFQTVPVALLKGTNKENDRGAGILLSISSLPSVFGIGDLGPGAKAFVDFLSRSNQKFWQMLPVNPIDALQGYSPYSSASAYAGNILLISPELLMEDGLLTNEDLRSSHLPQTDQVDYAAVEKIKMELFEKAWQHFEECSNEKSAQDFEAFCKTESNWLDDFAMYMLLKTKLSKPWYEWPDEYKLRDAAALKKIATTNLKEIRRQKWLQYLFVKQWKALKKYSNDRGIKLIGDLPFYVSYDSADVWANRNFFHLNKEGEMLGVAGVPPDSFSADGQLWGMPVYNWKILEQRNFGWWIERLDKNLKLFDLVRLDHFRAFAGYWEVSAGEATAKNGAWKKGPGTAFFGAVQKHFESMPFIAEDLGEIDEAVIKLREEFLLPGMKILQFAFEADMASSDYIPHNYTTPFFVYTGTHDNNTTKGWYRNETDKEQRQRMNEYVGHELTEDTVSMELCRVVYASVAHTAILPVQDVLGLDESARMNTPASSQQNWRWRLLPEQLTTMHEEHLKGWTQLYHRI